jgi:hypothetical protein
MKNILIIAFLLQFYSNNILSQTDSARYHNLIKHYDTNEIIYNDYVDKFWDNLSTSGKVFVDSILTVDPYTIDSPRIETMIRTSVESNQYPPIGLAAGLSGHVLFDCTIDQNGKILNDSVLWTDNKAFSLLSIDFLEKVKYSSLPVKVKGNKVKFSMMVSFVLKRKKNPDIENVSVYKSNCMIECPSYTITLNKDGTVLYEGNSKTNKPGKWIAQSDKRAFESIISILYKYDFFSMKESYYIDVSDLGGISVTVKTSSETKVVGTNYYRPLQAITYIVEKITDQLDWKKVED